MTRTSLVIGVDIGVVGALALLTSDGDLVDIADMPVLQDGPARRRAVNAALLLSIIVRMRPSQAFVEFVAARPGDAPAGAFAFGRCRGVVEASLAACEVPLAFLTPATWKRAVGIPPGKGMKDLARSEAIRRWPARAGLFARALDHDRAEAALIAIAGMARRAPL